MLTKILEFSLNKRLLILLAALALMLTGLYFARSMNVDVFPDLTAPTVTILTEAHGLESEEVEKLLSFQIETAMNGAPNVRRIRSSSAAGISIVWVEFEWGTDIYRARQIVGERLPMIREKLPEGVGEPTLAPISSIMGEIMLLAVQSDSLSPLELRSLADWNISPQLKALGGIANVLVIGGAYKQYQVLARPAQMQQYQVSLMELQEAVRQSNSSSTGGFFNAHGQQYNIKGAGRAYDLEQIRQGLVKRINGQAIRIADVAEVGIGAADKIGEGSLNAQPAVILTLTKQPDVNTLELTERIDSALVQLKSSLPAHVRIRSHIFRQADFIQASISNLQQTLLEGAFFVVVVLFIFLLNWRTTLISLLAIPLSLLAAVLVLEALGYTLNTMSLGGMAIAIGALVDDAIIDVENVFRRLRENAQRPVEQRQPLLKVVRDASVEIRSAIIVATLIIIVSFVPLFFLSGMEGRLLQPLGIAFITAVLSSLIVAVTVTPVLCSYLLAHPKRLQKQAEGTRLERALRKGYAHLLRQSFRFSKWIIGLTLLAFIGSLFTFFQLGRSFLPEFNEGSLVISVVGLPGMSLEESNKVGKRVEELLLELPEISVVTRRTGRAELDEHAQGVHAAELDAPFELKEGQSKEAFLQRLRQQLAVVPGINITIGQPIAHRIDHMLSGTRANIAIKLFGPDLSRLYQLGKEVQTVAQGVAGLADLSVEQQIEVPQIRIKPDRVQLAGQGMRVEQLMHFVETAFGGQQLGQIYEGQKHFDLILRYPLALRDNIEQLRETLVDLPEGGQLPLSALAEVQSVSSPHRISREDVQRKVVVSANVQGRDLRGAVTALQKAIGQEVALPSGYRIVYGGQFEREAAASRQLLIAAILAIGLIFILLYWEFKSLLLATLVLLNLPLALIGGIWIVHFSSGIISIATTIGFISLLGIATRNGLLLISRYQDLEKEGKQGDDLILQGSLDRLNPIIMTALTTALALIPLALKGNEAGNEIQSPMAVVILGGLLSATLLNLLVIPSVYRLLYKRKG